MNDQLVQCFVNALGLDPSTVIGSLAYNSIPQWDSIGHMALVAEIENTFNITLDTNEILSMSSVDICRDILAIHGINLNAA